jgi:chloramphenicol 3-O phosphotransferase
MVIKNKKRLVYITFFGAIIVVAGLNIFHGLKKTKAYGTVIILNGPSGSGKSSIQKEFQSLMMPNLWIKLGIDNLFDKPMPDINLENMQFWQSENPIRWIETTKDADQNPVITLFVGQQGENVAYGMNSAIAEYAKNDCNIIVDYIAYKKEWLDDLRHKLDGVKTYWVKVSIPLSVVEEREVARGTSPKGHARSHFNTVFWDLKYDLDVNSDKESAIEIARKIKEFLKI